MQGEKPLILYRLLIALLFHTHTATRRTCYKYNYIRRTPKAVVGRLPPRVRRCGSVETNIRLYGEHRIDPPPAAGKAAPNRRYINIHETQNAGSRFPIRQQSGKIPLNAPLAAHPFIFSYMFLQIKKYSYICL
nr:MAG TPA: hypothetical protein [Caudoviricetes sp.]